MILNSTVLCYLVQNALVPLHSIGTRILEQTYLPWSVLNLPPELKTYQGTIALMRG